MASFKDELHKAAKEALDKLVKSNEPHEGLLKAVNFKHQAAIHKYAHEVGRIHGLRPSVDSLGAYFHGSLPKIVELRQNLGFDPVDKHDAEDWDGPHVHIIQNIRQHPKYTGIMAHITHEVDHSTGHATGHIQLTPSDE